jgi:N-acetylmuramoyl-L-alanine amidase
MRKINKVIIHCSDTYCTMDVGVEEIRRWHLKRGWSDIGYAYIIRRNGIVERGRPLSVVGAHTKGHNTDSIGVCLVGGKKGKGCNADNFTENQILAAQVLLEDLLSVFPGVTFHGHNEFSNKACPVIDIKKIIP